MDEAHRQQKNSRRGGRSSSLRVGRPEGAVGLQSSGAEGRQDLQYLRGVCDCIVRILEIHTGGLGETGSLLPLSSMIGNPISVHGSEFHLNSGS